MYEILRLSFLISVLALGTQGQAVVRSSLVPFSNSSITSSHSSTATSSSHLSSSSSTSVGCNECTLIVGELWLQYALETSTTTSTITATPVPHVTVYPNGTEITSWATVTGSGPNATATLQGLPTFGGPTWTFGALTLTHPTTYVYFRDWMPQFSTGAPSCLPSYAKDGYLPVSHTPLSSFVAPMPSGASSFQLVVPPTGLVNYVNGLPEVSGQFPTSDNLATCTIKPQDNNGQSTVASVAKTTVAVLVTAEPAAPIKVNAPPSTGSTDDPNTGGTTGGATDGNTGGVQQTDADSGTISVGGQEVPVNQGSNGAVVVAGQSVQPGQIATINGERVSISPQQAPPNGQQTGPTAVVVNGITQAVIPLPSLTATAAPVLVVGAQSITANANGNFVIAAGATLTPGQVATIGGNTISIAATGGAAVVNGVTQTLAAAATAAGGQGIATPGPNGILTIGGQTYAPSVSAGKTLYSLAPGVTLTAEGGTPVSWTTDIDGKTILLAGSTSLTVPAKTSATATSSRTTSSSSSTDGVGDAVASGLGLTSASNNAAPIPTAHGTRLGGTVFVIIGVLEVFLA